MYSAFRTACERVLRIPADPEPPPGDDASTKIYRAADNYYKYLLIVWALSSFATILPTLVAAIACLIAAVTSNLNPWFTLIPAVLLVVMIVVSVVHLAVVRLNYEKRWYIVTDRSLRVREGVIGIQEMTVTFANIQNISISQGPIQRLLGIADLRVDTAGGAGAMAQSHHGMAQQAHVAWFRGVDNAPQVREVIQSRLRQWKDAGLGDHDDRSADAFAPERLDVLTALRNVHAAAVALRETAANPA
jgi:membrane protein YdbS with pleckstrin-like domain